MSWSSLQGNQFVDHADLQDAVDKGFFLVNNGIPVSPNRFITGNEAKSYVQLDESKIPSQFLERWVPKEYLVGIFPSIVTEFSPLASPRKLVFNPDNGLIYFIDRDNSTAGLWYFDPVTAQTPDDFNFVPNTTNPLRPNNQMSLTDIVYYNGKIYTHGDFSGGMLVVDCSTNAIETTIDYGTDANFARQQMTLLETHIWAYDSSSSAFKIINPATNGIVGSFSLSSIPGYDSHLSSTVKFINSKIWVLLTSSSTSASSIVRIYDNVAVPNYTTDLAGSINNIGGTVSGDGKIESPDMYWDSAKGSVYIPSTGDKKVYTYDDTTFSAGTTITIPGEGKTYAYTRFIFRETTGQLYFSVLLRNSIGDETTLRREYNIDRTNKAILSTQEDVYYSSMVYVSSTEFNYVTSPGDVYPTSDYQTDGKIIALN